MARLFFTSSIFVNTLDVFEVSLIESKQVRIETTSEGFVCDQGGRLIGKYESEGTGRHAELSMDEFTRLIETRVVPKKNILGIDNVDGLPLMSIENLVRIKTNDEDKRGGERYE